MSGVFSPFVENGLYTEIGILQKYSMNGPLSEFSVSDFC